MLSDLSYLWPCLYGSQKLLAPLSTLIVGEFVNRQVFGMAVRPDHIDHVIVDGALNVDTFFHACRRGKIYGAVVITSIAVVGPLIAIATPIVLLRVTEENAGGHNCAGTVPEGGQAVVVVLIGDQQSIGRFGQRDFVLSP